MKKITNKNQYDELITKINENINWYERKNFDDKVYNLTLDNGEKLKIIFSHNTIAHLLGIDTEYLKTTGQFCKDSFDILKMVCNDSYRLYNMVSHGHLTYDSFISDYTEEKLEGFQNICGVDLDNIDFVCKYSKEYSYVTGHPQLEADYYIGYKTNNGLFVIGLKKNGSYYYPMTNRYLDNDDKETVKFLQQMLENQKITMPTMSSIYFKETNSYSRTLFLKYNRKATKIRILNNYAKNYGATIDVSNGYSHAIEKLLQQFDAKDVLFPALEQIFKKVTKRVRINVTDIELEFGELPEEILRLIDDYNESLNTDISAAVDEHTKMVEDENKDLKEQRKRHLEELEALKQELLEAKSIIQTLEQENTEYKRREEETISVMKRIYSI